MASEDEEDLDQLRLLTQELERNADGESSMEVLDIQSQDHAKKESAYAREEPEESPITIALLQNRALQSLLENQLAAVEAAIGSTESKIRACEGSSGAETQEQTTKRRGLARIRCGHPYFEDAMGRRPPDNADTIALNHSRGKQYNVSVCE